MANGKFHITCHFRFIASDQLDAVLRTIQKVGTGSKEYCVICYLFFFFNPNTGL